MTTLADKWMQMDRRIIFAAVGICVLFPLLVGPFRLPIATTQAVRSVYDTIESLPEGSTILVSMDFDPASKPELYPMTLSIMRHAFRQKVRVLGMNLWFPGIGMSEQLMSQAAREYGAQYGQDYAYLGWMPGMVNVIVGMGQDLFKTFPKDHYRNDTSSLSVLEGVRSLRDIDYMIDMAAGYPGIEEWIVYGKEKYKFLMAAGCTAVTAPGMYIYLQSGQLNGLIGGMRGAAEYEALLNRPDTAIIGMDVQSVTHFLIIGLVLVSNALYLMTRKER